MKILVINAGSSSLKYQLIDMDTKAVLAKGLCERITLEGSKLNHTPAGGEKVVIESPMPSHAEAIKLVIDALVDKNHGVIESMSEIGAVGHRVVHGGESFSESVVITDEVKKAIEGCIELAPLHNPANLIGIEACEKVMPGVPQVGVFDTAFHQTMPEEAYLYGIPYEYYEKYKIRRYGFHGTSHNYVSGKAAELLGKDIKDVNIITCHLGNGSSVAAVKGGKVIDTTMGLTPLAGILMGTRSGDIDPAIVTFLMEKENLGINEINAVLNKKSGVLGVSGVSSDFRDLSQAAEEGNKRADAALKMFSYGIKKYIGSYAAAMGGVDAIVFTAGVGENDCATRADIVDGLEFLGVKIDADKNSLRGQAIDVSAEGATVRTLVIPTDEEMMIAIETERLTK
ncbi:MAG: acetate kinase [Ruminococcaceae bacterium]|nr:acetate kinase [Oscillospiraceae bacterium]